MSKSASWVINAMDEKKEGESKKRWVKSHERKEKNEKKENEDESKKAWVMSHEQKEKKRK